MTKYSQLSFFCNNCNQSFKELENISLERHLHTMIINENAEINEHEDHLIQTYDHGYRCPLCSHPANLWEFIPEHVREIRNSKGCAICSSTPDECNCRTHYDTEHDILYIEQGNPEVAEYEPVVEDAYLRVTPDGRTIGALIIDYSKKNEEWLKEVLPNELFEHLKMERIKI